MLDATDEGDVGRAGAASRGGFGLGVPKADVEGLGDVHHVARYTGTGELVCQQLAETSQLTRIATGGAEEVLEDLLLVERPVDVEVVLFNGDQADLLEAPFLQRGQTLLSSPLTVPPHQSRVHLERVADCGASGTGRERGSESFRRLPGGRVVILIESKGTEDLIDRTALDGRVACRIDIPSWIGV